MPCVTVSNRYDERGIEMSIDMMKYWKKVFNKPYPNGWKDKPNKTTPIRGKVMDAYDSAMDEIDSRVLSLGSSVIDHDFMIEQNEGRFSDVYKEIEKENGLIAKLADTKITKIYAGSNGATVLTDSDNGKIQDMILYGKSEQKKYSGYNLLDFSNAKGGSNVGVTVTINADGSYSYVGTPTETNVNVWLLGNYVSNTPMLTLAPGKYYVKGVNLYYNSTSIFTGGRNGGFITLTEDTPIAGIRAVSGEVGTSYNETWYPIIAKSDVEVPWEPYVGGIPSPNPDYPQEIKSVVNPTVKVCGKNLLNCTLATTTLNGVTLTNNGDGTYTLNGTASGDATFILGKISTDSSPVRLVGCPPNGGYNTYRINLSGYGSDIGSGNTFVLPINTTDMLLQVISGTVCNNLVFKPMITTDLTATYNDYEPYTEQTVTLPFTLNAIPVSEGGNVTIDGQQYIADYVDVENGKLHRLVDSSKLDNSVSIIDNAALLFENETSIDLTDEQVNALKALSSYYPTTNVAVTSEQLDGYTTFNYPLDFDSAAEYASGSLQYAFESGLEKGTFRIYGSDSKESMYDIRIAVFDSTGVAKQLTQFSLYAYGGKSVGNGTVNTSYGVIRQNGSGYVQLETKADYNWKVWISGKGWRVEKV